ncbi:MAG: protein kinase [Woeseiaceae bacterium]|nr:protein kinase [Woeseiaceae bacterium]
MHCPGQQADKRVTANVGKTTIYVQNGWPSAVPLPSCVTAWNERLEGGCCRCRIESALGRGGMGIVFSATRDDDRFRRDVAIKIVPPLQGAVSRERFLKERHILAKLDSPNIALLHDAVKPKKAGRSMSWNASRVSTLTNSASNAHWDERV